MINTRNIYVYVEFKYINSMLLFWKTYVFLLFSINSAVHYSYTYVTWYNFSKMNLFQNFTEKSTIIFFFTSPRAKFEFYTGSGESYYKRPNTHFVRNRHPPYIFTDTRYTVVLVHGYWTRTFGRKRLPHTPRVHVCKCGCSGIHTSRVYTRV